MKISHKWFHIKQSNILQTSVPIKSSNCSLLEKLKIRFKRKLREFAKCFHLLSCTVAILQISRLESSES